MEELQFSSPIKHQSLQSGHPCPYDIIEDSDAVKRRHLACIVAEGEASIGGPALDAKHRGCQSRAKAVNQNSLALQIAAFAVDKRSKAGMNRGCMPHSKLKAECIGFPPRL